MHPSYQAEEISRANQALHAEVHSFAEEIGQGSENYGLNIESSRRGFEEAPFHMLLQGQRL